jgi:hypothetical protein
MDDRSQQRTVKIYAGKSGEDSVFEELPVIEINPNKFQLLSSPGLALNLAKGDIFEFRSTTEPVHVISRGGNFCVQIYSENLDEKQIESLSIDVSQKLNGQLDGVFFGNLTFSVPALTGVDKINAVFDKFTKKSQVQWYYSNIYKNFDNPEDEELLNWWL